MKTSFKGNNTISVELVSQRLNKRYSVILKDIQDQIIKLLNKFPSDDFANKFIFELSQNKSMQPLTALGKILLTYDAVTLLANFPKEYMELVNTLGELKNIQNIAQLLLQDEKAVLKELNNISICYN